MGTIISTLWQSDLGQITLVSLAYSLFGVLLVGGYLSYFGGGFGVIADLSLQDILFFVPSFVAGFSELVWQEGMKWVKKIFRWLGSYVVGPFLAGLLLTVLLHYFGIEARENESLFSIGFVLWVAGLEGVIWPSQRKWMKALFWLLMTGALAMLFFFAPQAGRSSEEVVLISPFLDRELVAWSGIIEFFLLPMIIGREIARTLFEQRELLKVEKCDTKVSNSCEEETFLVALLRKWVILYMTSTSTGGTSAKGNLLLLSSEQARSFVLGTERTSTKGKNA